MYRFLLFVDIIWLWGWVAAMIYFESVSPQFAIYRLQTRVIYRHIVCTLALAYNVARPNSSAFGFFPFIVAWLDDFINLLDLTRRLDPLQSTTGWNLCAWLTGMAFAVSSLAILAWVIQRKQS